MKPLRQRRLFGRKIEDLSALLKSDTPAQEESKLLKTVGWVTAGLGAVALGLVVGRELRLRYNFNRRTPYDFYSHSGDDMQDVDFSLGI